MTGLSKGFCGGLAASAAAALIAWPTVAKAQTTQPTTTEEVTSLAAETGSARCLRSFEDAQKRRAEGALRAAREELILCGQADCPAVVQSQCVAWLRELEESLPSIVVIAKNEAGQDAVDVRVTSDGEVLAEALDGRPISLDPGPRTLRFEHRNSAPIEMDVVVVEGKKNREITLRFSPKTLVSSSQKRRPQARPAPPIEPLPPALHEPAPSGGALFYAGLSVGAAGMLAGTLAGVVALTQGSALTNECTGGVCPADKKDELESSTTVAHVSTASFAVGGAGLLVALITHLVSRPDGGEPRSATAAGASIRASSFVWTGHF